MTLKKGAESIFDENFYHVLYLEHIEEISFLLVQRLEFIHDKTIGWLEVVDLEKKLMLLLDSIDVGANYSAVSIDQALESGDEDLMLGAVFSLSSTALSNEKSVCRLFEFFKKEADLIQLLCPALMQSLNKHLISMAYDFLETTDNVGKIAVLDVLGYRADADPHRIWSLFHDKDKAVRIAAMTAAMRLGFKKGVLAMELAVLDKQEMFSEHCVFPLLMLGSQKALHFSRLACQSAHHIKPQYPVYLGLAGNEEDLAIILKALKFNDMNLAVLEALGTLGALEGVNTLMKFLSSKDDEEKLAAAKSLNQISGAQLYEMLSVLEKEDDEIDAQAITGKAMASNDNSIDGKGSDERVIEIKQDCTDKQRWVNWWQKNKARFDQSVRYRHGKPYSFLLLLQEIAHTETVFDDRQRAYNELVMRSGHHIPFEPDWFVDKQIAALKKWQTWWNENKSALTNQWMFDGK